MEVTTQDGKTVAGVVCKPPGKGPFPAIMILHGGLEPIPLSTLEVLAHHAWTTQHFVTAGYVISMPALRTRAEQPQAPAILDALAFLDTMRDLDEVDERQTFVYGMSGGGDLALELAGLRDPVAIAIEEPPTVLFTGIFNSTTPKAGSQYSVEEAWPQNLLELYTDAIQLKTREKIERIDAPILILEGDQLLEGVDPRRGLHEILIPALRAAKRKIKIARYPGQTHGFLFSAGMGPENSSDSIRSACDEACREMVTFFRRASGQA